MNKWEMDPSCNCEYCVEFRSTGRKPAQFEEPDTGNKTVLDEARECVDSSRQNNYGSPEMNFRIIGEMWGSTLSALEGWHKGDPVPPRVVGLMMINLKVARDCHKPLSDNLIDIAGYVYAISKI